MTATQLLLDCGVAAGVTFVGVFLLEDLLRPGYNSFRQPVSSLSYGPHGWIQQANFYINGALLMAYAWGLSLALPGAFWGPLFVFFHGFGLVGTGLFITDYGRTHSGATYFGHTLSGALHDLFSTIVFTSLSMACLMFTFIFLQLGSSDWAAYSFITGIGYGIGFVIFAFALSPRSRLSAVGGLLQRITILVGVAWVILVALHLQ